MGAVIAGVAFTALTSGPTVVDDVAEWASERNRREAPRGDACVAATNTIETAQEVYLVEHGTYADSVQELVDASILRGDFGRAAKPVSPGPSSPS